MVRLGPVSIPFIAGQWSLPDEAARAEIRRKVSIPFIAGQWSLLPTPRPPPPPPGGGFNPLHCGAVVASEGAAVPGPGAVQVSIPFIAGQWSLPRRAASGCRRPRSVSIPFIAGQWSLPLSARLERSGQPHVSIPFIAGQWSLPGRTGALCRT